MLMTIPTSFYESLAGLENMQPVAVCFGLRRSATTMIWQVLRDVFPEGGVIKTHTWLDVPADVPVVVTVRDPRDCAASWWRLTRQDVRERNAKEVVRRVVESGCWSAGFFNYPPMTAATMTCEDAAGAAGLVTLDAWHLAQYQARHKRLLLLRYENFAGHETTLAAVLREFLCRPVTADILTAHDLRHNWGMDKWGDTPVGDWDSATATGPKDGGHCGTGKVGAWRECCTEGSAAYLTALLAPVMERLGYNA